MKVEVGDKYIMQYNRGDNNWVPYPDRTQFECIYVTPGGNALIADRSGYEFLIQKSFFGKSLVPAEQSE